MKTPGVYTVAADCDFAGGLAFHVFKTFGSDPLLFSRVTVFVPSRRACRSLREQFLKLTAGKPLLLPKIRPLGDVDEDDLYLQLLAERPDYKMLAVLPAPISKIHRILELSELVWKFHSRAFGHEAQRDQAVWMARELVRFLDEVEGQELSFERLKSLVPEMFAEHWQQSVKFLSILSEHYIPHLRSLNLESAVERRNALLHLVAERWEKNPPKDPIVVAGSTGTNPASANLIRCVSKLPNGYVVLPGLDVSMSDEAWKNVGDTHPQYTLKQLLEFMAVPRSDIQILEEEKRCPSERMKLLSVAMLPAEETSGWPTHSIDLKNALQNVEYISCDTSDEEAQVVALILRDALETPNKTAALVTHDRGLARRVVQHMKRFDVSLDDTAGKPLALTEAGAFFRLVLEVAAENAAPVPLLALLKHPLVHAGIAAADCRRLARLIERYVLRGNRPADGLDGIAARLKNTAEDVSECLDLLQRIKTCFAPLMGLFVQNEIALSELVAQHKQCADFMLLDEQNKTAIESAEGGKELLDFIDEAITQSAHASSIPPHTYAGILDALMADVTWRPVYGQHPRLHILSPLEARMQHFDRVVLGGLNEESWPPALAADPWMSRPMRAGFGLPSLEKKISQAAHDFTMQFNAPELFLTRAIKSEGKQATECRWLTRLHALVEGKGGALSSRPWREWLRELQHVVVEAPLLRPAPKPPLSARPRMLYVTRIEMLLRDPYALYARHILKLRKLEPVDKEMDARDFGNLVHAALEKFLQTYPEKIPDNAADVLFGIGREVFEKIKAHPAHHALWWARFERIAEWVIGEEQLRRSNIQQVASELEGEVDFDAPGGKFTLKAYADRMELLKDGSIAVIDYKTGAPPSQKDAERGYASQLPLEAAIAERSGFAGYKGKVSELAFWQLKGTAEGGDIKSLKEIDTLKDEAWAGVQTLIAGYDNPEKPYAATPRLDEKPKYSDYEHLERLEEWSGG